MIGLIKAVPLWAWIMLTLTAVLGSTYLRLEETKHSLDAVTDQRDVATARAESIGKTLTLQRQLTADANEAADHATQQTAHVSAAVVVADDHARSLQQQVTDLLAKRKRCTADLASTGKARDDLADLLADLRREADDEAGSLAEALDRSRIAGQLCESMYSAAMKAR